MSTVDPHAADLDRRWQAARFGALAIAASRAVEPTESESWLIQLCASAAPEALHRAVYDNGLRLGSSFARFRGGPVAAEALPALRGACAAPACAATFSPSLAATRWTGSPARTPTPVPATTGVRPPPG